MGSAQTSIDVDVPVHVAYQAWNDFSSFPRFMSDVRSVTRTGEDRYHWVASFNGRHQEFDVEVVQRETDRRLAWRSVGNGDGRHSAHVSFEPLGEGRTRVVMALEWAPQWFSDMAPAALRAYARRFKLVVEEDRL